MVDPSLDRKSAWLNEGLNQMLRIDDPCTSCLLIGLGKFGKGLLDLFAMARIIFLDGSLTPTGVKVHLLNNLCCPCVTETSFDLIMPLMSILVNLMI